MGKEIWVLINSICARPNLSNSQYSALFILSKKEIRNEEDFIFSGFVVL